MTPLILLHGFLGCRRDFDALIAGLDGLPATAIDLPGHGNQPPPAAGASFADGVDLVAEQVRQPSWLIGYSMGGRLALALLAQHPELVRGVVAIGANIGINDTRRRQQRLTADRALADQLESGDLHGFLDQWYAQPLFASLRCQPSFEQLRSRRGQEDPRAMSAALRTFSVGRQPDYRDALARTGAPVLLVAGARDTKYASKNAQLRDEIAGIECREIDGAGHCVPLEQPGVLAEIVSAFATRH